MNTELLKSIFKQQKFTVIILTVFFFLFADIAFVNHQNFRTYTLDLGLYTNAIYDYGHFHFNDSSSFKEGGDNLLSDHFDLFLMLISPLGYLFGSYTLLLIQILSFLTGALGIRKCLLLFTRSELTARLAMISFLFYFSIYSSCSFDYHSNVIAACTLPWLIYFLAKSHKLGSLLLTILILITKENMSLWMVAVFIALAFLLKNNRKWIAILALLSFAYFIVITSFVMPALASNGQFVQFKYHALGNNYAEAIKSLFTKPFQLIQLLWTKGIGDKHVSGVKIEFLLFFLLSGGLLLFKKPYWLIACLPIVLQKLWHDNPQTWGINGQYSIELAPIVVIGGFLIIHQLRTEKLKKPMYIAFMIVNIACTIRLMDNTVVFIPKSSIRVYQSMHYKTDLNKSEIKFALDQIPNDAVVSAQAMIQPHLSYRDKSYCFPIIKDASYLLIYKNANPYPLDSLSFANEYAKLQQDSSWQKILDSDVLLLKRKD